AARLSSRAPLGRCLYGSRPASRSNIRAHTNPNLAPASLGLFLYWAGCGGAEASGDFLPPSPPAEKATICHYEAGYRLSPSLEDCPGARNSRWALGGSVALL